MASLPNPYGPTTPIGASMQGLMKTLFTPTRGIDPTRQDYNRAAAAKARAETDALHAQAGGMSSLGDLTRDIISSPTPEGVRPDPGFVGPMPAMSRSDYLTSRMGDINAAGLRADLNPTQIGQLVFQTARQANLPAEEVARFSPDFLPLDKGITFDDRNSLIAQENAAARDKAIAVAQADPVKIGEGDKALFGPNDPRGSGTVLGLPTINTQRGAVAAEARETGELSPIGQRILGGSTGTPRNYITSTGQRGRTVDGITDLTTGAPLPQDAQVFTGQVQGEDAAGLTGKMQSAVQGDTLAGKRFKSLLDQTRTMAAQDPMNFGVPGFIKGVAQDVTALGQGIATGLGYQGVDEAVTDARSSIVRSGVDPSLLSGVFDPNLPALHTLSDLLVYNAAATLAGQEGRDVSDRDVKIFKNIVGDPRDWLMSQEKYLAKLDIIEQILVGRTGATEKFISEQKGGAAPQAAPPPAAVEHLRANPSLREAFDQKYGAGAAARALGSQ